MAVVPSTVVCGCCPARPCRARCVRRARCEWTSAGRIQPALVDTTRARLWAHRARCCPPRSALGSAAPRRGSDAAAGDDAEEEGDRREDEQDEPDPEQE